MKVPPSRKAAEGSTVPPGASAASLVWLEGQDLSFAVGDTVTWPTRAPDATALEPLLGARAGAVTHVVETGVEPLKLRKVTGTVARIESVRYAVMCDEDAEGWVVLPGSAQWAESTAVPSPSSSDKWLDHEAHLVTIL